MHVKGTEAKAVLGSLVSRETDSWRKADRLRGWANTASACVCVCVSVYVRVCVCV